MSRATTVDEYISRAQQFQVELLRLRKILLSTKLEETVKWGAPCYTFDGSNVVGLGSFKSYVGLWFFQGALLSDPESVLINAQEGKTKAMRQWRFTSEKEIRVRSIKAYVREAISVQQQGLRVTPARSRAVVIPVELQQALDAHTEVHSAFRALTQGRRREYAQYIAEAKRAATRLRRLEKILPMIKAGVGLHDKYRDC